MHSTCYYFITGSKFWNFAELHTLTLAAILMHSCWVHMVSVHPPHQQAWGVILDGTPFSWVNVLQILDQ